MKTVTNVHERLLEAIKEHSHMTTEEIKDVRNADDGYSGFCYYSDTVKFYDANESDIWELLEQAADDQGIKPLALVASFGCAESITDSDTFKNALSWFALEEVSHYLESR